MARISVIIPTYNCAEYVAQTLHGVVRQDWEDLEIIVVDDGSTDGTPGIAASYGSQVRLIVQDNAGVCAARNRGIEMATGEYICLLDHDDYWLPGKLHQQVRTLEGYPGAGVVYSSFQHWTRRSDGCFPAPETFSAERQVTDIDAAYSGWIYHLFLLDCWMLTSTAMFRREVFDRCGVFDPTLPYSEDWDLWLRISRVYPFVKLKQATTLYRQHPQQGNRLNRTVDYRTELLRSAVAKWGFSSPDGNAVTRREFHKRLASYHAEFGLGHLKGGRRAIGIQSLFKAWLADPFTWKYLAYLPPSIIGWKPTW